jgi:hypothetical protein
MLHKLSIVLAVHLYNHWLHAEQIEINQETAYALLPALKAVIKDMVFISERYSLDSYRQACIAIAQAEKSIPVRDARISEAER